MEIVVISKDADHYIFKFESGEVAEEVEKKVNEGYMLAMKEDGTNTKDVFWYNPPENLTVDVECDISNVIVVLRRVYPKRFTIRLSFWNDTLSNYHIPGLVKPGYIYDPPSYKGWVVKKKSHYSSLGYGHGTVKDDRHPLQSFRQIPPKTLK